VQLSRIAVDAPWWAKIAAKIILSRAPLAYRTWSSLGIFRHGASDDVAYGFGVFRQHFENVRPNPGFVTLELGPGDALASAVVSKAFGGGMSFQVDVGPFASRNVDIYRRQARYCNEQGLTAPNLSSAATLEDVLAVCQSSYKTKGISSLREIPTASVDFAYSHSCLEHIRSGEFLETMQELRRILKPTGGASHSVDFKDHLQASLNNLRFSAKVWESALMASSGFYTNRIRPTAMLDLMRKAGFATDVIARDHWPSIPTPRSVLNAEYRNLPDEELLVKRMIIRCWPKN